MSELYLRIETAMPVPDGEWPTEEIRYCDDQEYIEVPEPELLGLKVLLPGDGPMAERNGFIRCKQYMIAELDLKQLISAKSLKERFLEIAKRPSNGGLFHIAEILNIIESEQNKMEEVDRLRKERP